MAQPTVILFSDDSMETKLNWYEVTRGGEHGGEILAAFELFLVSRVIVATFYPFFYLPSFTLLNLLYVYSYTHIPC